ncbi:MAG: hypothetical protein ACP5NE_02215 [Candidatus Micrarchaeia archaeon]
MPTLFKEESKHDRAIETAEHKSDKYRIQMDENSITVFSHSKLFFNREVKIFKISIEEEKVKYFGRWLNTEIPINKIPKGALPFETEKIDLLIEGIIIGLKEESSKLLNYYLKSNYFAAISQLSSNSSPYISELPVTSPYNVEIEKLSNFVAYLRK